MSKILKIIIAIIGLLILWIATLYFRRRPIEQDLTNQVTAALNRPEFSQVTILFEGRDGILTGEVSSQALAGEAEKLAKKYWGVRVIDNQLKIPAAPLATTLAHLQGYHQNGKFVLYGVVPDKEMRTKLIHQAEKVFGAGNIIDQLSIDAGVQMPEFFDKAYAAFLGLKEIDDAGFSIRGDKFVLKGNVPTDAIKARLVDEIINGLAPLQVQNELQVVSIEASKPSLNELRAFFRTNVIEFEFASANLIEPSRRILDRVTEKLKQLPETNIELEGHTDNIGSEGYNLRLSQARASAVQTYLVKKGIAAARLNTRGYGETQPKATNDTEEGRQRNRRVEIKAK